MPHKFSLTNYTVERMSSYGNKLTSVLNAEGTLYTTNRKGSNVVLSPTESTIIMVLGEKNLYRISTDNRSTYIMIRTK